jgi:hypothetical protein
MPQLNVVLAGHFGFGHINQLQNLTVHKAISGLIYFSHKLF